MTYTRMTFSRPIGNKNVSPLRATGDENVQRCERANAPAALYWLLPVPNDRRRQDSFVQGVAGQSLRCIIDMI